MAAAPPPAASTRRWALYGALALALLAAAWWARRWFSEEAQVRRVMQRAARAVAEEKLLALAPLFSRRYSDPYGLSYESLLGLAADTFSNYQDLRLSWSLDEVQIAGPTAAAALTFRLSGESAGRSGNLIGDLLHPARAGVRFRKERGGWVLEHVDSLEIPNAAPPPSAPAP